MLFAVDHLKHLYLKHRTLQKIYIQFKIYIQNKQIK